MQALAFWKAVTVDNADFLGTLISLLEELKVKYCVIGGQGVNAYVEPLVSLDLDLALAAGEIDRILPTLEERFEVERFPHSLNLSLDNSKLRVQLQTDARYSLFAGNAEVREVLGLELPVASLENVLQGKIWAASDETRRPSKRRKDILDIERIIEARPELRSHVPQALLDRLAD
jgi:hypothetical protein